MKNNKQKKIKYYVFYSFFYTPFLMFSLFILYNVYFTEKKEDEIIIEENTHSNINNKQLELENINTNLLFPIEISIKADVNNETKINLSEYKLTKNSLEIINAKLPKFAKLKEEFLILSPKKSDFGIYKIDLHNEKQDILIKINVGLPEINIKKLKEEITLFLKKIGMLDRYGIFIKDLFRGTTIGINEDKKFPPASTAKVPIAILVLRDIEQGKYTLNSTFPVDRRYQFGFDFIANQPPGTLLTVERYLRDMLIDSSNSAWYHLVAMLGHSYEVVNPRTIKELGVNPFFMDPYLATARNMVKTFEDVYFHRTLSKESAEYFFNLLKSAVPVNKEGIGLGIKPGATFANKIGYHWTNDLVNYVDIAIVWGINTDYIVGVLNRDVNWSSGKQNIREISRIIANYVDTN